MATAGDKSTQFWLREANDRLVESHGTPRLAEMVLRETFSSADPGSWGYLRKVGKATDDRFWREAKFNFEENSAVIRSFKIFFVGGSGPDSGGGGPEGAEYYGVWVDRAHLLALLPEHCEPNETELQGAAHWIAAEARRMKKANQIPDSIRITEFARELARRMSKAAEADRTIRPVEMRYIRNSLRDWGLWPVTSIRIR